MESDDLAVQGTNASAAESKWLAAQHGYLRDPYVSYFVKTRKSLQNSPIMNRGYYARVASITHLMHKFIATFDQRVQIISLGAGSDTTFFQLHDSNIHPLRYVELDFKNVTISKVSVIRKHKELYEKLGDEWISCTTKEKGELHCGNYHLVPVDLRDFQSVQGAFNRSGLERNVPTFILSECVLIYLTPDDSNKIIQWTSEFFETAFFVTYEQIGLPTSFTRTMQQNFGVSLTISHPQFKSRGCPLLGISAVPSLEAQERKYTSNGFTTSFGIDMIKVYSFLDPTENRRIEKIERFDEYEEWKIMLSHYCLVCSSLDKTQDTRMRQFAKPEDAFSPIQAE